jgi:hypothetical protein
MVAKLNISLIFLFLNCAQSWKLDSNRTKFESWINHKYATGAWKDLEGTPKKTIDVRILKEIKNVQVSLKNQF